ncbi:MAG TPA: hypothetical protein VF148_04835 [Acidimicrobiia bacterium]
MRQTSAVAEMQLRELARRKMAIALLVALPLVIYLSIPAGELWAVVPAVVGLAWAVGGAAMFAALGWRRVDPRLSLVGHRPIAQILGRSLPIAALGLLLGAAIFPLILFRSDPSDPTMVVTAIALTVLVGTPLGLAIGSLLSREMEAMLVLIGVGAIANVMPPELTSAQLVPLWAPVRLLVTAIYTDGNGYGPPVTHGLASAAVLMTIAWLAWRRRARVRTSAVSAGWLSLLKVLEASPLAQRRKVARTVEQGGLKEP